MKTTYSTYYCTIASTLCPATTWLTDRHLDASFTESLTFLNFCQKSQTWDNARNHAIIWPWMLEVYSQVAGLWTPLAIGWEPQSSGGHSSTLRRASRGGSGIWWGCLPGEVLQVCPSEQSPWGRPRTRSMSLSWLGNASPFPQAVEKEIWASLLKMLTP